MTQTNPLLLKRHNDDSNYTVCVCKMGNTRLGRETRFTRRRERSGIGHMISFLSSLFSLLFSKISDRAILERAVKIHVFTHLSCPITSRESKQYLMTLK